MPVYGAVLVAAQDRGLHGALLHQTGEETVAKDTIITLDELEKALGFAHKSSGEIP